MSKKLQISYENNTIATISPGQTAVVKCNEMKMGENIIVKIVKEVLPYLTFSSPNSFSLSVYNKKQNWNGTLEYSTNAQTWKVWSGSDSIYSSLDGKLYIRGIGNTYITCSPSTSSNSVRWVFSGSNISCIGNIETLLDYQTVINGEHPIMANSCYKYLFDGCKSLITAPELPATTLTAFCYEYMFSDCSGLTNAPELPATTLGTYCYGHMFSGCSGLTIAPELPATTLKNNCYEYMFRRCTGLTTAPELPATTLANNCYSNMFEGCSSLTTAPELPATTLGTYCYDSMFRDCRGLTTIPALPATTLKRNCYEYMFYNCTNIKLSETSTGDYTMAYRIPTSETGTNDTQALNGMFMSTGGTFTGTPSINKTYYTSNTVI